MLRLATASIARMRRYSALIAGVLALSLLAGCTLAATTGEGAPLADSGQPVLPSTPSTDDGTDLAAQQQAQVWFDAAAVPPGSVAVSEPPTVFNSYQGWPCQPVETLEGYWTLADWTGAAATNWLRENPTADLVSTAVGPPLEDDSRFGEATVGYIPADDSHQGVVYTVVEHPGGVAIRAEIAALAEGATCPDYALGKPGQG